MTPYIFFSGAGISIQEEVLVVAKKKWENENKEIHVCVKADLLDVEQEIKAKSVRGGGRGGLLSWIMSSKQGRRMLHST